MRTDESGAAGDEVQTHARYGGTCRDPAGARIGAAFAFILVCSSRPVAIADLRLTTVKD
jgi:hypothetical protein